MRQTKPRPPTREQRLKNIEEGVLDHTGEDVPFFELEDWEIRGDPPPSEATTRHAKPTNRKASGRRAL